MAAVLTAALAVPATLLTPSVAEAAQASSQKKTTQKKASTAKKQTAKKKTSTAKKAAVAAPVVLSAAEIAAQQRRAGPDLIESRLDVPLAIESRAALITNARTGEVLYAKNVHQSMPIASITKLMTAMIVLDAGLELNDPITITEADVDHLRHTHSRLSVGTTLTRADMLLLALMASENRAASALARTYPGGLSAALDAMNRKARSLGMPNTHFYDGTGLHGGNVSTPGELTKMVQAAYRYPDIRAFSTMPSYQVTSRGQVLQYNNTNGLVKKPEWDIGVSKTGFINEAGRCLVMMAHIEDMPVVIVLMDSWGKYTRIGDANRVKKWLEVALRS
ncbi:UNVERIFIED_CONTAM: pbpG [Trichonephila clavipes]